MIPDACPMCHHSGNMEIITSHFNVDGGSIEYRSKELQVVLQCPRNSCKAYSIAYYRPNSTNYNAFYFKNIRPTNYAAVEFPDKISQISEEFVEIYNQANKAESLGLSKIAGVGYRKALEFLIKDYLIYLKPDDEDQIKKKFLGKCIAEDVGNQNIKDVCSRAVWLGNDRRICRIWEAKDVSDLKAVILLAVHWIESELLTADLRERYAAS